MKPIQTALTASLLALGAAVAGFLPTIASLAFLGLGTIAAWIGTAMMGASAALAKSHDDNDEKMAWAIVSLAALIVLIVVAVTSWNNWSILTKFLVVAAPAALLAVALGVQRE